MRQVYEFKDKTKALDIIGKDDILSRQSTYIRTSSSLNLQGDKTYLIFDGSEESVKRAEELLKGLVTKSKDAKSVLKNFDEIESQSADSFGFLGI